MSFSIDQKLLKNILDSIKDVAPKNKNNIQEIRLSADKEGLSVTSFDAEQSLFVDVFLHSDIFNEYNIEEYVYIDLNVEFLRKQISTTDNILITFKKVSGKKAEEIGISFGKKIKSANKLTAIETEKDDIQIDEYEYNIQFTVDATLFKQMIARLSSCADTCKIQCTEEDGLRFTAVHNAGSSEELIEIDELSDLKDVKINTKKVASILGTNALSDQLFIQICDNDDIPIAMCISYIKNHSYMKYYFSKMDIREE